MTEVTSRILWEKFINAATQNEKFDVIAYVQTVSNELYEEMAQWWYKNINSAMISKEGEFKVIMFKRNENNELAKTVLNA